jgi:hypothetical protein
MGGFAFAEEELGYVYFKFEVMDTPWTGYVPPRAANLSHMVCLDITFQSNLPREYTDYFIDLFENWEVNDGISGAPFSYSGKIFAQFTRTEDGFVSRRPFAKRWDVTRGSWDSPNLGSYEDYRMDVMQHWVVNGVQTILNAAGENLTVRVVGDTAIPSLFADVEQGFGFRQTNHFERRWIIYRR